MIEVRAELRPGDLGAIAGFVRTDATPSDRWGPEILVERYELVLSVG